MGVWLFLAFNERCRTSRRASSCLKSCCLGLFVAKRERVGGKLTIPLGWGPDGIARDWFGASRPVPCEMGASWRALPGPSSHALHLQLSNCLRCRATGRSKQFWRVDGKMRLSVSYVVAQLKAFRLPLSRRSGAATGPSGYAQLLVSSTLLL